MAYAVPDLLICLRRFTAIGIEIADNIVFTADAALAFLDNTGRIAGVRHAVRRAHRNRNFSAGVQFHTFAADNHGQLAVQNFPCFMTQSVRLKRQYFAGIDNDDFFAYIAASIFASSGR